ncbi:hypothetical protein [Denitromonas ohlonensis]|uniref:Lipopolysaccharide N-acetylglucosaminyl transferase n=2 Tax=Denitromonas TaxID=139331 RepID=A0A557SDZ9_9RHOO|nr:hypothetical protein [Denitromonas ohlonensis]TVO64986.1 hypothetical protein FHP90_11655 [Denitromonas ohlonensis]TVO75659.1 hypothetical protein FHP89_13015 [Denitromonas ohlonensis]
MFALLSGLSALLLEALALWLLGTADSRTHPLAVVLLPHLAASALLALSALALMPALTARSRRASGLLMFALSAFIPGLGFAGIMAGLWIGRYRLAARRPRGLRTLELPALDPHQRERSGFHQTGAGGFLRNPRAPTPQRLKALVALQHVPGRVASPLLRDLLGDDSEDLRLLAYGMLDRKEKTLNAQIQAERQRLASARSAITLALAHTRLAGLYWELIYQQLAQGDLRTHAAESGLHHAREALALRPNGAGLYLRCGQCLLALGNTTEAEVAFEAARAAGLPDHRVLPHLAELAFLRRDFAAVRRLLAPLASWRGMMGVQKVAQFWSPR